MATEKFWTGFNNQSIYAERADKDRKGRGIAESVDELATKVDGKLNKVKVDGVALAVTTENDEKVVDVPLAVAPDVSQSVAGNSGVISKETKAKIDGMSEGANKVESSLTNGNIKIDGVETTVYTHPSKTAHTEKLYKVANDAEGHITSATEVDTSDIMPLVGVDNKTIKKNASDSNKLYLDETKETISNTDYITGIGGDPIKAARAVADENGDNIATSLSNRYTKSEVYTKQEVEDLLDAHAMFIASPSAWEDYKTAHPTGDPSVTYYVLNNVGGRDNYDVYQWDKDAGVYKLVDQSNISLDGYWHGTITVVGNGNLITDISVGNDGTVTVTKGSTLGTGSLLLQLGSGSATDTGFNANSTSNVTIQIPLASHTESSDPTPVVTYTEGLMTGQDKEKLDNVEAGAEVNAIEIVKKNGTALTIDSTDRSVNVVVNDGKLKKKIGSDATATEIFSADSSSDYTLEIPLASVDNTGATPVYSEGLMSAADKQKLDETVSAEDATITINVGGAASGETAPTAGDFTTNQSSNETITIPAAVSSYTTQETDPDTGEPTEITHPATPGVMSSADKEKLDSVVSAEDATITLEMGGWAIGDTPTSVGDFTTNQSSNETLTIPAAASSYTTQGIDPDTGEPIAITHPATPGVMGSSDKSKLDSITGIFRDIYVTDKDGHTSHITATSNQATGINDNFSLVAGNNVDLTLDTNNNEITIESTGGSGSTVSAGRGIAVNPTVDQQTGVTDYEVSLDNATGYLGSTCTIASVSTSPVDILDPSATPSIDSQNDRFVVQLNQTDNHVYLYALKTVKDALNPSNDVAGVDVFTLSYNVQVSRTQSNGFYGMAGVQIQRDSSSTIVLHSSTESYPSQVGECSVNGCATIWNNSGNETTIGGKVYYGYRLIYTGDASTGVSDILGVVARFTAIENMSGTAEYTGSMTTYNAGAAIDISQSNDISVVAGQGLTVDSNTNSLQINLATDSGLTFASEGGLLALKLNNVTEAVVQEVQKMSADMDSKLTTTFDMAQITNVYDFADSGVSSIGNGAGMIFQAFTVPINNSIRLATASQDGTLFGIYAKQAYTTKIMLALYMYNFDDDSTEYIADTGAVSVAAGRNEFPIQHINSAVTELESKNVYYAALYLPSTRNNGLILAGCESYSSAGTINVIPRFTVRSENLTVNGSEIDLDVAADARLNYLNPNDPTRYLIGPWSDGYNEQPGVPRFFMQIRNGHVGGGNNNA